MSRASQPGRRAAASHGSQAGGRLRSDAGTEHRRRGVGFVAVEIYDGTGAAAVVFEHAVEVNEYATGECVSVTGTNVPKPSDAAPVYGEYRWNATRAENGTDS